MLRIVNHKTGTMSLTPHSEGFTSSTAVPLYWVQYGAKGGRVLVLHGGPGAHHDYLLPQMLTLAQGRSLIFYDQRGSGRSPDESRGEITWRTHVQDLAALARELSVEPLTIIGYSWGALLALLYTAETRKDSTVPAPVRLVLINPAPSSREYRKALESELARRGRAPAIAARREALNRSELRDSDPVRYRKELFELSVAGYFHDTERARELTPFRVIGRVQESVWKSLGDYALSTSLRDLDIPALVVHGRDDPIPLQSSIEVADALGARLLVLERCGHVPYVERPDALFQTIETFLRDYPR